MEVTPQFFTLLKSFFSSKFLLLLSSSSFFVFQRVVTYTKCSVELEMCFLISLSESQLIFSIGENTGS